MRMVEVESRVSVAAPCGPGPAAELPLVQDSAFPRVCFVKVKLPEFLLAEDK